MINFCTLYDSKWFKYTFNRVKIKLSSNNLIICRSVCMKTTESLLRVNEEAIKGEEDRNATGFQRFAAIAGVILFLFFSIWFFAF